METGRALLGADAHRALARAAGVFHNVLKPTGLEGKNIISVEYIPTMSNLGNTSGVTESSLTVTPFAPGKYEGAELHPHDGPLSPEECDIIRARTYRELHDFYEAGGRTDLKPAHVDDFFAHEQLKRLFPSGLKKPNRYELGAREFTLTYSPKWFDDAAARAEMTRAIDKLMKYYKDEIIDFRAVGEVGTNGLSHVHAFYKLARGVKITDKNFKRAWKHWNPKKKQGWGFEGGHHAVVKVESDFLGYMEKDIDTAWIDRKFISSV